MDNYLDLANDIRVQALFSDGTEFFCSPGEAVPGDKVTVRLRVLWQSSATTAGREQDVTEAAVVMGNRELPMTIEPSKNRQIDMRFAYYRVDFEIGSERVDYCFRVRIADYTVYYDRAGASFTPRRDYLFSVIPGFSTPSWADGAVMYQIFTDRFAWGDSGNNPVDDEYYYIDRPIRYIRDWNRYPESMSVAHFYGGDLTGIMKKLDYLQELGVEVLYLNPIFVSPSNHKYDIQDYDYVDPHLAVIIKDEGELLSRGDSNNTHATRFICRVTDLANLEASNRYFAMFVREIHARNMKIILDGVFNHCGSFNKWIDAEKIYMTSGKYEPGAYIDENSPYHDYFGFDGGEWPDNNRYEGWWGHRTLPKLNYEATEELCNYILSVAKKWVSPPYNIDGWRLDVAADLGHSPEFNHKFWKEFRRVVKEANPNAIIIAENYMDSEQWLKGDEWDTIMNYEAFMEPVTWFLTGMEKHSDRFDAGMRCNVDAFFNTMRFNMARLNHKSLSCAMNQLSNHDHSRFMTRTNMTVGRTDRLGAESANRNIHPELMREAIVMQMTWPGAPTLYYGDEAGLCGWTDPDNRRTFPWGHEDKALLKFYRDLIRLHKSYEALRVGSCVFLGGHDGALAYGRFTEDECFAIAVNAGDGPMDLDVPVWLIGMRNGQRMIRLAYTDRWGYNFGASLFFVEDGFIRVHLEPACAVVIKNLPDNVI